MNDIKSLYWTVSGSYDEIIENVSKFDPDQMRKLIINEHYNKFCLKRADGKDESDHKLIPYMGWFWRATNFADLKIPIGFGDGYVGVMENNKWNYHERYMTEDEARTFIGFIDAAIAEDRKGGSLSEIIEKTRAEIDKIHPWMQGLPRHVEGAA